MVSGCGGMRPHLAGAVDAAGPRICHCEEAAGRRGNLGKALPFGTSHRQNGNRPRLVIARSEATWQSREGTALRNEPSSKRQPPPTCHCEEAQPTWQSREGTSSSYKVPIKTYQPIASVAALTAQPLAALPPYGCGVPLAGSERLAGWQYSGHVFYGMRPPSLSFRGAKRRGNLLQQPSNSPRLSCHPTEYCEIATAPTEPRNDKSGGLSPPGGAQGQT